MCSIEANIKLCAKNDAYSYYEELDIALYSFMNLVFCMFTQKITMFQLYFYFDLCDLVRLLDIENNLHKIMNLITKFVNFEPHMVLPSLTYVYLTRKHPNTQPLDPIVISRTVSCKKSSENKKITLKICVSKNKHLISS